MQTMTSCPLLDDAASAQAAEALPAFPAIEQVLPHRGTMRLVDEIAACSDDTVTVLAHVDAQAWYADAEGAMPSWLGIELMAQAIATHVGLLALRAGGRARPGVLLGASRYEVQAPSFARGARLRVQATELLKSEAGHGAYECTIAADDRCVAQAVIKVFQPHDFEAFIEGSFTS